MIIVVKIILFSNSSISIYDCIFFFMLQEGIRCFCLNNYMILHWKFQLLLIGIHAVRKVQLEAMAEHHYQFHNFKLLTTTPPQAMEYVFFFWFGWVCCGFCGELFSFSGTGFAPRKNCKLLQVSSDGAICKASRVSVSRHFAPPGLTFLRLLQW